VKQQWKMGLLNLVVDASLLILLSNIRQSCYLGYFAKKFAPIEMFFLFVVG